MNSERITRDYDASVITFSHFVPRPELMRATVQDEVEIALERNMMVSCGNLGTMYWDNRQPVSPGFINWTIDNDRGDVVYYNLLTVSTGSTIS